MQVALSRPLVQGKYDNESYRTPYYPNVYLTSDFTYIHYLSPGNNTHTNLWQDKTDYPMYFDCGATNAENFQLLQAFSPEINVRRSDVLSRLKSDRIQISAYNFSTEN